MYLLVCFATADQQIKWVPEYGRRLNNACSQQDYRPTKQDLAVADHATSYRRCRPTRYGITNRETKKVSIEHGHELVIQCPLSQVYSESGYPMCTVQYHVLC